MNVDTTTEYLGLKLATPLVASASPCTGQVDVLQQLEDCGAGAAVLPSLFEEQIVGGPGDFGFLQSYNHGVEHYCHFISAARSAVSMPIIASLNGTTPGGWLALAKQIEQAGADALELNLHHVPAEVTKTGTDVESRLLELVAQIRDQNDIPLAVKIGPNYTSLPHFAWQLTEVAADGLILFNRFLEPNINLEQGTIEPHLELSTANEARLAIRWIGILRDQLPEVSLAASGGFHNGIDALKAIAVGADVVMVTAALLRFGIDYLESMRRDVVEWLRAHQLASVDALRGSMSRQKYNAPEVFERVNYAQTLSSYFDQGTRPC